VQPLDKTVVALALHAGDFARPKGGLDHALILLVPR
jgi:hypothetical protein